MQPQRTNDDAGYGHNDTLPPPPLTDKPWTIPSQHTIHNQSTISHSSRALPAHTALLTLSLLGFKVKSSSARTEVCLLKIRH
jgi:hypothetical protein